MGRRKKIAFSSNFLQNVKTAVILVVVSVLGRVMAGFHHADFSAYLHSNLHHNAVCLKVQVLKDLDKLKIANISNI